MLAAIQLSPSAAGVATRLRLIADFLVAVNVAWLREQLAFGRTPPLRMFLAAPPWTPVGPVRWVPYHGGERLSERRTYRDGPSAFATREATCIDIAAYDVAAATVLAKRDGWTVEVPSQDSLDLHAWVRHPGGLHDPTTEFRRRQSEKAA